VHEKESEKEVIKNQAYPVHVAGPRQPEAELDRKGRICGIPNTWFFLLAALVLVAIIAVAVACGVVFSNKTFVRASIVVFSIPELIIGGLQELECHSFNEESGDSLIDVNHFSHLYGQSGHQHWRRNRPTILFRHGCLEWERYRDSVGQFWNRF
jgi:hypothetical protein